MARIIRKYLFRKVGKVGAVSLLVVLGGMCYLVFPWKRLIQVKSTKLIESSASPAPVPLNPPDKTPVTPTDMSVDPILLKLRGIDPDIGIYFQKSPRFLPGEYGVNIVVNGQSSIRVHASFDAEGALCLNEALLRQLLIHPPAGECPGSQIKTDLYPNQQRVELFVPPAWLESKSNQREAKYQYGGMAGIVNYEIWTSKDPFTSWKNPLHYAGMEWGFNAGNFVFRSRQTHVKYSTESSKINSLYTYLQHALEPLQATVQWGHIVPVSGLFSLPTLYGVQMFSEAALGRNRIKRGERISGVAAAPARIEVRQSGILVYSTLVPIGPFTLRPVPLISRAALEVSVFEENRVPRHFTVPVESFLFPTVKPSTGFKIIMGQRASAGFLNNTSSTPSLVIVGEGYWHLSPDYTVAAGILSCSTRQAIGMQFSVPVSTKMQFNVGTKLSLDTICQQWGMQGELQWRMQLIKGISATVFAAGQTTYGYHTPLAETTEKWPVGDRYRYGGALNWRYANLGVGKVGFTQRVPFEGPTERRLTVAWARQFKSLSLSLNVEWHARESEAVYRQIYLRASLPLSRQVSLHSSGQYYPGNLYPVDLQVSDRFSEWLNYQISTELSPVNPRFNYSAQINLLPRYFQMGLHHHYRDAHTYYSAQVSGSMALHNKGISFAPYRIEDTFALASVGRLSGVQIRAPHGRVCTGGLGGMAVLPSIVPYTAASVCVLTRTLPTSVDLQNGCKTLQLARGSVAILHFDAIKTQRALLTVVDREGYPLSKGLAVFDAQGHFVTLIGEKGILFLADSPPKIPLYVKLSEGKMCQIQWRSSPMKASPNRYYEKIKAVCQ